MPSTPFSPRPMPVGTAAAALLLAATWLATPPRSLAAQSVLERTPNLSGGWVGTPGPVHLNVVHRFWSVDAGSEGKVVNSPTILLALPLPGRLLAGANYATNALVARDRPNEWEAFLRWTLPLPWEAPVGVALAGARNGAAGSWDGELSASAWLGSGRGVAFLASARRLGNAFGRGEPATAVAGGVVLRLSPGLSVSADVGRLVDDGGAGDLDDGTLWGAGLQFRIPATPHTVSLHAANTRTGTLQGSSSRFRTTWGFEFTIPLVPGRYLPGLRGDEGGAGGRGPGGGEAPGSGAAPPGAGEAGTGGAEIEIGMTDGLRFSPDVLRIRVGETVTWRNAGVLEHTVTADPARVRSGSPVLLPAGAEGFDSGPIPAGGVFRHTFTVPGTWVYQCIPHEPVGMTGVILVTP